MVEGYAGLYPAVLVEDVGVQTRVHALSWAAGGEGAAAAKKGLKSGQGKDIWRGDGKAFEAEVDMGKCGEIGVDWWGLSWEGEEAAGIGSWSVEVGFGDGGDYWAKD